MEKKRILLIHPEISRTKYNFVGVIENECLELEYISTILKEDGHEVFCMMVRLRDDCMQKK